VFRRKKQKSYSRRNKENRFALPEETKQWIWGILMILSALLIGLSFFAKAGMAGQFFLGKAKLLVGETVFPIPFVLLFGGIVLLKSKHNFIAVSSQKKILWPVMLAVLLVISGITGILGAFDPLLKRGGWAGYFISWPFLKYFGFWATLIIFLAPIIIGFLIFWQFIKKSGSKEETMPNAAGGEEKEKKPSIIRKFFAPKFEVKEVPPFSQPENKQSEKQPAPAKLEQKPAIGAKLSSYQPPPLDLLEKEHGVPTSGDTRINSAIIKKTFQNFGIEVAMSEVNIGPTVTQYTLKPAEGVKLSKITSLSNDLALALASHPIRIEAPIPGRALVGIEMPNKVRAQVRLRNLIENQDFQKSSANLLIALGRDVSGATFFTDLTKMPHMLVAGSTGSGKTIFLNTLILSLLYQPNNYPRSSGPEFLRFILVDPKRVEFPVYNNLPHLLCPVIYNATQTLNALRWLTGEMERRFDVLAEAKSRDIKSFNEQALKNNTEPLPFIVVVIDELADLMAARGREIEAAIVRLAQMARAVGIHLVVATQRPSVEVITGLIKANIISRVTFQVASQVDSRTILDTSGAEKLLGAGDLLYISGDVTKPKRIQGAYVSDKEVRKIVSYITSQKEKEAAWSAEMDSGLVQALENGGEEAAAEGSSSSGFSNGEADPLFAEAKRLVVEAKKASASLLQRRLRIGYARAARLIDMLEENGVVGPAEGAKPREVYSIQESSQSIPVENADSGEEKWEKI